ncbi:hypothetical protein VitviT2T_013902 [Vitis vinifera]|uniref:Uncharacterized protein n=1 Tax=Vitis vinifera TaxID=29760 RepID=A0ABY9CKS7_VITVI|nr:hypothetical protein VitviT2T_013902 [Vitis vinifera]
MCCLVVSKILKSSQLTKCSSLEHEEQIPSCAILSLTVNDPCNLPEKKTTVVPEVASNKVLGDASKNEAMETTSLVGNQDMDLWDASNGLSPPMEENVLCMEKHHRHLGFFCLRIVRLRLEKIQRDFLWGGGSLDSKPYLVKWDTVCSDRRRGALGARCLHSLNKASFVSGIGALLQKGRPFGDKAFVVNMGIWKEVELPYFPLDFPDTDAYSSFMATEATSNEKEKLHPPSMRALRVPIPPPWVSVRLGFDKVSSSLGNTRPCEEKYSRDVANGDSFTNSKMAVVIYH